MGRYFVVMPTATMRTEAIAMLDLDRIETQAYYSVHDERLLIADLSDEELTSARDSDARVFADVKFETYQSRNPLDWRSLQSKYWETPPTGVFALAPARPPQFGLNDVMQHINAPQAWGITRGAGVHIAIVDTGVSPTLKEIPTSKRSLLDIPNAYRGQHWSDVKGHGSMCAVIATGTRRAGGRFDGVAPEATLICARTTMWATDIYKIYDSLVQWKKGPQSGPLVVSNSYGLYTCAPPATLPEDHPYLDIVLAAVDAGIVVVCAAGNNHYDVLCNHDPTACEPTTIWAVNSHDRVLCVGTVNKDNTNRDPSTPHVNSSRGPGQWAQELPKPDCVAPTYGEVVWGSDYRVMDWWGTSGACPQVAGLAALILSVNGSLTPREVGDIVRGTARDIDAPHNCVGHGLIDCFAAVQQATH